MSIRDLFKIFELTFNKVISGKGKMQYKETAFAQVSSPNFEDPAIVAESEEKRLENSVAVPGDSGLNY